MTKLFMGNDSMLLMKLLMVFIIASLACWGLAKLAPTLHLMAKPGGHRKHEDATPMVGGLAIFIALVFGLLIDDSFKLLLPSLLVLCFVGALDDRFSLPSLFRLIVQAAAAYLMIKITGIRLVDLGYLFSSEERVLLGYWSTAMTVFASIGVINAINMSDGMDGLAGSLVLLLLLALLFTNSPSLSLILVAMASVSGFLIWNLRLGRPKAFIFMGDSGSTMLGLLIAFLLIEYSQVNDGFPPVTALWLLAVPLIDTVAALIVRPIRGKSPFSADRTHYHHQLLARGLSVNTTLILVLALQSLFIILGFWLWHKQVSEHVQLRLFLTLFTCYMANLLWFTRTSKLNEG